MDCGTIGICFSCGVAGAIFCDADMGVLLKGDRLGFANWLEDAWIAFNQRHDVRQCPMVPEAALQTVVQTLERIGEKSFQVSGFGR